jgi:hypothetical protein
VVEQPRHRPVTGKYRDDIARLDQVLAGMVYPTQKWQLIAHATHPTPKDHSLLERWP